MNFIDGLNQYFTNVLDVTMYISYFFFTLALVFTDLPKEWNKKTVLITIAKAVVVYALYVVIEAFFFALTTLLSTPNNMSLGGLIFTASFAVIPAVYLFIFLRKEGWIHKLIKIEMIVAVFLTVGEISRDLGVSISEVSGNNQLLVVLLRSFPFIFLPLISFLIHKFNIKRFKKLPPTHIVIVSILSAVLIIQSIWQNQLNSEDQSTRWLLIFICVFMLVVLTAMYYAAYKVVDIRHQYAALEVQTSVLQLEKDSLKMDKQNREELIKIRHDLRNQLSYVKVMLDEGKYQEAIGYINELIDNKQEYLESFSCPNTVIGGIVNLELTKAKLAEKKIKFNVVVPPRLPFEDSDLLSLITNIVDNCLENFVPKNDEDSVMVSILTQQDYLRITAFNSIGEQNPKRILSLRTTKNERSHGYGTKIIKNIVNKYNGYSSFTVENGRFVCDCVLEMKEISGEKENA